ncbi:hypothetical protein [Micromonospora okii]|uniref:hypothetical protein n=1 Tax=Micromonospora okii TaxID=1182970 RepID=UPI001E505DBA|nr:hypothetical protein [Micromonospora okii]
MDLFDFEAVRTADTGGEVYDRLDFEARDAVDADAAAHMREVVTGLPARPGVLR